MEHEKNAHILYCSDEDWEKVQDLLHPVRDAKEPTCGPEEIGYSLALPVLDVSDLGLGIDHYPRRMPVPHHLVGTNPHDLLYVDTDGKLAFLDLQSLAAGGDEVLMEKVEDLLTTILYAAAEAVEIKAPGHSGSRVRFHSERRKRQKLTHRPGMPGDKGRKRVLTTPKDLTKCLIADT